METESVLALRLGSESGLFRSRDAVAAGVSRGVHQLPQARQVDPIAVFTTTHPGDRERH